MSLRRRLELIEESAGEQWARDYPNFEVCHPRHGEHQRRQATPPTRSRKYYFNNYYASGLSARRADQNLAGAGPPEECAALIQGWIDMGITTPVLRFTVAQSDRSDGTVHQRSAAAFAVEVTAQSLIKSSHGVTGME